jgi:hypothetical protein
LIELPDSSEPMSTSKPDCDPAAAAVPAIVRSDSALDIAPAI